MMNSDNKVSVQVNVFGVPYELKVDAESKEKLLYCAEKLNKLIRQKSEKLGDTTTSQIKILVLLCLDFLSDQIDSEEVIIRIENLLDRSL